MDSTGESERLEQRSRELVGHFKASLDEAWEGLRPTYDDDDPALRLSEEDALAALRSALAALEWFSRKYARHWYSRDDCRKLAQWQFEAWEAITEPEGSIEEYRRHMNRAAYHYLDFVWDEFLVYVTYSWHHMLSTSSA